MEHKIIIVGIGPGSEEYILPIALKKINEAKVLVGGKRALSQYAHKNQKTAPITVNIQAALTFVREQVTTEDVVVMVSGDPGFYSFLPALRSQFPVKQLEIIPGISSMQLAFSRIGLPWQNSDLLSLHGRLPDYASLAYVKGRTVGILTDVEHNSQRVAMLLLDAGWPANTRVYICEHLSYPGEAIHSAGLLEATAREAIKNCVMVVLG